jgi:hypothetical protein
MNPIRQAVLDRIWRGQDPLTHASANLFGHDLQGWRSQHRYLHEGIAEVRPVITVEIGVWKGASTLHMAECLKQAESGAVIAVDTWLGSVEHWVLPEYFAEMSFFAGYPAMYHKFIGNVLRAGLADYVVPLPLDSINAAHLLQHTAIIPGMIHLDAGHSYDGVLSDLRSWWPLLAPGGLLIGDDYHADGSFEGVRRAFDEFFAALGYPAIEHDGGKCRIRKQA